MKGWIKELVIGIVSVGIGVYFLLRYLPETLSVIKGIIGPILLVLGGIFVWIGIEDKKLERELQELEKELGTEE